MSRAYSRCFLGMQTVGGRDFLGMVIAMSVDGTGAGTQTSQGAGRFASMQERDEGSPGLSYIWLILATRQVVDV